MKMRKFFVVLLALAMILTIASCSPKSKGDNDTGANDSTGGDIDTSIVPDSDYSFSIKEEIVVVHETEDGRKSTKVLRYPEISGMSDSALQESINATFRSVAERQFVLNVPDVDIYIIEDTLFNYEVSNVEVTFFSNSFMSVKNTVYSMTSVSEYPECPVYTVNISLESGEIIDEDEIFADFNSIASMFLLGDFSMVYGMEDLLSQTNYEDMILQYKSDYASYPNVYFTSDEFVICIDLVAALQSSAGFSCPIENVAEYLSINPTSVD